MFTYVLPKMYSNCSISSMHCTVCGKQAHTLLNFLKLPKSLSTPDKSPNEPPTTKKAEIDEKCNQKCERVTKIPFDVNQTEIQESFNSNSILDSDLLTDSSEDDEDGNIVMTTADVNVEKNNISDSDDSTNSSSCMEAIPTCGRTLCEQRIKLNRKNEIKRVRREIADRENNVGKSSENMHALLPKNHLELNLQQKNTNLLY